MAASATTITRTRMSNRDAHGHGHHVGPPQHELRTMTLAADRARDPVHASSAALTSVPCCSGRLRGAIFNPERQEARRDQGRGSSTAPGARLHALHAPGVLAWPAAFVVAPGRSTSSGPDLPGVFDAVQLLARAREQVLLRLVQRERHRRGRAALGKASGRAATTPSSTAARQRHRRLVDLIAGVVRRVQSGTSIRTHSR